MTHQPWPAAPGQVPARSAWSEELGPALGGVGRGVGRRHEVLHDVDEALGVVELGQMASLLEDLKAATRHGLLSGVPGSTGSTASSLPQTISVGICSAR